jgi:hypothetical protein
MEQLTGFSEIALALAGFAAIALVLGRREGVLPTGNAFVVQFMVVNTLGPAVLALLAVVLVELGIPEPGLWRLCSGLYLVGAAGGVAASLLREREIAQSGEVAMSPGFRRVGWGMSIVAHGIELVNFIGYPAGPSLGLFLLGLWVMVALGAVQFVVLLFSTMR